ncbi:thioredoxin domain-containing protein [Dyadobacter sp. 3J3]|uniref:DsbA family protein n=1 Tax=Dyadobacter sp. 3J3 TaxID=2606600 RepID=UPI0013588BDC|nr:thioredoxin domain-containing protein [Dyadobacter sp. 3J3]
MSSHLKPAVSSQDHIQGNAEALIEIVEYGDYQCPHCGTAYAVIKEIQNKFDNQIRFVFRNFPLSESHEFAMPAAVASEAAGLQGKFWEMHDIIFENQNSLNNDGLIKMASEIGLNNEKFRKDIQNPELEKKVESDFESGVRSGVNGTPSFFVNGTKFDGDAQDLMDMLTENSTD